MADLVMVLLFLAFCVLFLCALAWSVFVAFKVWPKAWRALKKMEGDE